MNKKNIIALLFAAMASVQSAHADMNTDAVLLQQLARVRQATARYHDVSQAEVGRQSGFPPVDSARVGLAGESKWNVRGLEPGCSVRLRRQEQLT